jgi:O-antigen/teichoic acid export membrane protein
MGMACSTLVIVVMTRCALRVEMRRFGIQNWWREAWAEWPVLVSFSLPAFLTTLIAGPVYWACNALLANQPSGYEELGIFNASNQWYAIVGFLPGVISTAVFPVFSERYGAKDVASGVSTMKKLMLVTSIIVIPMVIVLGMFSPSIMRGYGESFEKGWGVLIMSMAAASAQAVTVPCWSTIMASGRMWVCFVMNIGWSVLLLMGSVFLINYGAMGVASARFVAFVVHGCWIYAYVSWMAKKDLVNFE